MAASTSLDSTSASTGPLRIGLTEQGTTSTVQLEGELGLAAQETVRKALEEALCRGPECLVLDLSPLRFIDSTGIRLIAQFAKRSEQQGVRLVIVPGPGAVQRVFEICRLGEVLPFVSQL